MARLPGPSARLKLATSYAGLVLVAGVLLLAVVWLFLLRYVPESPSTAPPAVVGSPDGAPGSPYSPDRSDLWRAFAPRAAVVLALLLVLGALGGWLLAGRMLSPLTRIADAARTASSGSLSHRIRMAGRNDELRELADAFDTMLERLESHVSEQQRFAANASHELRTPLAISQALLDVARDDPTYDRGVLLERLRTVNTRAIDLTEALLLLSRSEGASFPREHVDLSLVAEETIETLVPLAARHRVAIDVTGEATPTTGSPALLLRLLTNLVQNAIVHNLPDRGTATLHTEPQDGASLVRVENTGPLLHPDLVRTLTEPFRRGAPRVRLDEHPGVGLGLTIVHSIVRAHGGTLDLACRPAGGLLVTVRLPAATTERRR